jgi:hypothetical protein|tara:strand:+ start:23323 stop:23724 length:402 start_codon:yes stop_codon:yes gene_type:complete
MKIAVIGSIKYENTRKIKNLLTNLKQKFNDELIIISSGNKQGGDKHTKKFSLEFGIKYKEFNPAHTVQNLYSAMSERYYAKPYHVSQFHHRNMLIAKDCDYMIALIPEGVQHNELQSAIKQAIKLDKKVVIIT